MTSRFVNYVIPHIKDKHYFMLQETKIQKVKDLRKILANFPKPKIYEHEAFLLNKLSFPNNVQCLFIVSLHFQAFLAQSKLVQYLQHMEES